MERSTKIKIIVGVVAFLAYFGYRVNEQWSYLSPPPAAPAASGPKELPKLPGAGKPPLYKGKPVPPDLKQLIKEDVRIGNGAVAKPGKSVTVHYRGMLVDGSQFDASYDRGQPFTFSLGAGGVIRGWDQGVAGMKEGGKRRLLIPSDLGYGPQGSPPKIPPNAVLVFEIELIKVG